MTLMAMPVGRKRAGGMFVPASQLVPSLQEQVDRLTKVAQESVALCVDLLGRYGHPAAGLNVIWLRAGYVEKTTVEEWVHRVLTWQEQLEGGDSNG